jgi:hypothetical protein
MGAIQALDTRVAGRPRKGALAALTLALVGCREAAKEPPAPHDPEPWFVDVAGSSGLDFVHESGRSGALFLPEMMGSGVAFLDYDNDGDLDVYLVQGGRLLPPGDATGRSSEPRRGDLSDRLYRNDLGADGSLHFKDVTARSGIATRGYGMGVATGDVDGNGYTDLYVTSFGPNQLLLNQGDGTFRDATEKAGAGDPSWSSSAAFLDYDRDGRLDLYLANYVDLIFSTNKPCFMNNGQRDYCGPQSFRPLPHRLLHNKGDGTFEDVSERSRVGLVPGSGLGVSVADFDDDGWPDAYVANDQMENFLWLNGRDGTFRNVALERGAALAADGRPEASMGVDAGDFDNDGDEDVLVTNLTGQKTTLYVNEGHGTFSDLGVQSGIGQHGQRTTGFGAAWIDYDNDGLLDALVVNGRVFANEALVRAGDPFPYHERNQLLHNEGGGRFRDVTALAGAVFRGEGVHRGAAFGDVDNDGDLDVLVTQVDGPVKLLLNQVRGRGHWLGARLLTGRRDALGARAVLRRDNAPSLTRRARSDGSYCSANDPRVLFGLGPSPTTGILEVSWPDGRRERFRNLPADRYSDVIQGAGEALPQAPTQPG